MGPYTESLPLVLCVLKVDTVMVDTVMIDTVVVDNMTIVVPLMKDGLEDRLVLKKTFVVDIVQSYKTVKGDNLVYGAYVEEHRT